MRLETHATLSAISKLIGLFAGLAGGFVLGGGLASVVRWVAPGIHQGLWLFLVVPLALIGFVGGLYSVTFAVDFLWSHLSADCPDPACDGRVHPLRSHVYRCDRCGKTHGSVSTGGSEFPPIVRRVEARLERALHFEQRGSVSVVQPGSEGALSEPHTESRAKEKA